MSKPTSKPRQARQWELELCQRAQDVALSSLDADETVLAAAHWRSGLPAIAQLLLLGSLLGIPLVIIWQSRVGRGIVAVTQQRLLKIDLKKNMLADDWPLSKLHDVSFSKRPLLDDKLVWGNKEDGEVEIHLTGDWSFFHQTLCERLPA